MNAQRSNSCQYHLHKQPVLPIRNPTSEIEMTRSPMSAKREGASQLF
jgi:hypothetical protein